MNINSVNNQSFTGTYLIKAKDKAQRDEICDSILSMRNCCGDVDDNYAYTPCGEKEILYVNGDDYKAFKSIYPAATYEKVEEAFKKSAKVIDLTA